MNDLQRHAEVELGIISTLPDDDNLIKPFIPAIKELVKVFSDQGHSGGSAPYGVAALTDTLRKLLSYKPLTPVQGHKDEWVTIDPDGEIFQNIRLSSLFKQGKDGDPYYLDAIIWKDQSGFTFSGSALMPDGERIKSRQFVNLPFLPKTFYIDVMGVEVAKDDWEFRIRDVKQLKKVFKYYKRYEQDPSY